MKERELNDIAETLRILTIAFVENNTKCIAETYRYAYRTVGEFSLSVPCLASENAYNDFYNRTENDIRLFKIKDKIKDKSHKSFVVHQDYMYEHLIPAASFRDSLIKLYDTKQLNIDTIKQEILQQRMCWITKEEDVRLRQYGYSYKGRKTFEEAKQAYLNVGIRIKE